MEVAVITSTLKRSNLKLREGNSFVQGHTAVYYLSVDMKPDISQWLMFKQRCFQMNGTTLQLNISELALHWTYKLSLIY